MPGAHSDIRARKNWRYECTGVASGLMFNAGKLTPCSVSESLTGNRDALGIEGRINGVIAIQNCTMRLKMRADCNLPFKRNFLKFSLLNGKLCNCGIMYRNITLGSMFSAFDPFEAFTISDSALAIAAASVKSSLFLQRNDPVVSCFLLLWRI